MLLSNEESKSQGETKEVKYLVGGFNMSKADALTQENLIEEIDFKELSKNCKTEKDLASLTKQFMKNMIENMLKSELEEHIETEGNTPHPGGLILTTKE